MTRVEELNARGHANSWAAKMLQERCAQEGRTMAEAFREAAYECTGVNVLAKCTKASRWWIYYEFLDGSTDRYPNPRA